MRQELREKLFEDIDIVKKGIALLLYESLTGRHKVAPDKIFQLVRELEEKE